MSFLSVGISEAVRQRLSPLIDLLEGQPMKHGGLVLRCTEADLNGPMAHLHTVPWRNPDVPPLQLWVPIGEVLFALETTDQKPPIGFQT